ncbi:ABC transporter permease [Anaerolineales bacterium]
MMRFLLILWLLIYAFFFIFPSLIAGDPYTTHPELALAAPSLEHLMGMDHLGRDVLIRWLWGGQHTLFLSLLGLGIVCLVGILLTSLLALLPPLGRQFLEVILNAYLSIPGIILALMILTVLGRGSIQVVIALALTYIANFVLVMSTNFYQVLNSTFVQASLALGADRKHILKQHVLITILPLLVSYLLVLFSYMIISIAGFAFLGLMGDPTQPDWGIMLAESRNGFRVSPWIALFSGGSIVFVVGLANLTVDRLNQYWTASN